MTLVRSKIFDDVLLLAKLKF